MLLFFVGFFFSFFLKVRFTTVLTLQLTKHSMKRGTGDRLRKNKKETKLCVSFLLFILRHILIVWNNKEQHTLFVYLLFIDLHGSCKQLNCFDKMPLDTSPLPYAFEHTATYIWMTFPPNVLNELLEISISFLGLL